MAVVGELLVLIGANNTALTAGLAKSEAELKGFGSTATSSLTGVRMAALGMGVASVAASALAVSAAASFQEQMAIINTIAHQTPAELDKTGVAIRELSKSSGTGLPDLTKGFYDLLSAGIPAANAMSILTQANTLAIGGLATTAQTVDLLTTAVNAYHLTAKGAAVATDQFALAVQDGKVTADQIAATFADVAPLAKTMGIGIDEIATSYAVLTARGVKAPEAMTQMNRAMVELIKPNKELSELQKKLGVNFAEVARDKGLVVALEQMRIGAERVHVPFADLFGRLEGLKFALATTGPFFADYKNELVDMHSAGGTAAEQAEERMGTFSRQLSILGASVTDLGISIGTGLLPPLTAFVKSVSGVVQDISAWAEANPQVASTILPIVAAVSGLVVVATSLGAILGVVGTAVGIITSPITILAAAVGALAAGFGLFGEGPKDAIDGIVASIAALIPATGPVRDAIDGARTALGLLGDVITTVASAITGFVTNAGNQRTALTAIGTAADIARFALGLIGDVIRTVVTAVVSFVTSASNQRTALTAIGAAADAARVALKFVGDVIGVVVGWVTTFVASFRGGLTATNNMTAGVTSLGTTLTSIATAIATVVGGLATLILNIVDAANKAGVFKNIGDLVNAMLGVMGTAFGAVAGTVGTVIGKIAELIQGIKDAIAWIGKLGEASNAERAGWNAALGGRGGRGAPGLPLPTGGDSPIGQFASGGIVPGTGAQLAIVHGGETITPAGRATGGMVTHVTHSHIHLDGREIIDFVEEHLFNNASGYSSGFQGAPGVTGA